VAQLFSLGGIHFMKHQSSLLLVAALLMSLFTGCSKHSPPTSKAVDVGAVEVSNGSTNRTDMGRDRVHLLFSDTQAVFISYTPNSTN